MSANSNFAAFVLLRANSVSALKAVFAAASFAALSVAYPSVLRALSKSVLAIIAASDAAVAAVCAAFTFAEASDPHASTKEREYPSGLCKFLVSCALENSVSSFSALLMRSSSPVRFFFAYTGSVLLARSFFFFVSCLSLSILLVLSLCCFFGVSARFLRDFFSPGGSGFGGGGGHGNPNLSCLSRSCLKCLCSLFFENYSSSHRPDLTYIF